MELSSDVYDQINVLSHNFRQGLNIIKSRVNTLGLQLIKDRDTEAKSNYVDQGVNHVTIKMNNKQNQEVDKIACHFKGTKFHLNQPCGFVGRYEAVDNQKNDYYIQYEHYTDRILQKIESIKEIFK